MSPYQSITYWIHTTPGVPTYAIGLGLSIPSNFTLSNCTITGTSPVFSYRVYITFQTASAGALFQAHATTKASLTNLVRVWTSGRV